MINDNMNLEYCWFNFPLVFLIFLEILLGILKKNIFKVCRIFSFRYSLVLSLFDITARLESFSHFSGTRGMLLMRLCAKDDGSD